MGYVRDTTYKLTFEDFSDDDGNALEIRVKPLTVERWLAVQGNKLNSEELLALFEEHLTSWNLEERDAEGKVSPVPADHDGIHGQDASFMMQLIDLWAMQITGVSDPLPTTSSDGRQSLEESLPMEALSPSLPS